jgi:hypothetical protein
MPTTINEAQQIVMIINKYLSFEAARACTAELNNAVGQQSSNPSVKMTLQMLADLYENLEQDLIERWIALAKQLGYTEEEIGQVKGT